MYDVPWAGLAIGVSGGVAAVVSLAGTIGCGHPFWKLGALRLGPPNWNFSNSWASTFTAVGALLGTVLSAGLLSSPRLMSVNGYAGCNLFFGGLVVIAPFVFSAFQRLDLVQPAPDGSGVSYDGTAWAFLVSSAVTLWAVLGEVWVLMLLTWEFLHGPVAVACIAVLCVVEVLVLWYGQSSIRSVLKILAKAQAARIQAAEDDAKLTEEQKALAPLKLRWNVL